MPVIATWLATDRARDWRDEEGTASRQRDVLEEIADDPTSIIITRGGTTLSAQSVRLLIPRASGSESGSPGGEEARADLIVLGTNSLNIQRDDRFLVGTALYRVIYVSPAQPSVGERREAGAVQVQ